MLFILAIYEDGKLILLGQIPHVERARVIVNILEVWYATKQADVDTPVEGNWLGSLHHTLSGEIGDIVSPLFAPPCSYSTVTATGGSNLDVAVCCRRSCHQPHIAAASASATSPTTT
jgi:hypothetical protein